MNDLICKNLGFIMIAVAGAAIIGCHTPIRPDYPECSCFNVQPPYPFIGVIYKKGFPMETDCPICGGTAKITDVYSTLVFYQCRDWRCRSQVALHRDNLKLFTAKRN